MVHRKFQPQAARRTGTTDPRPAISRITIGIIITSPG